MSTFMKNSAASTALENSTAYKHLMNKTTQEGVNKTGRKISSFHSYTFCERPMYVDGQNVGGISRGQVQDIIQKLYTLKKEVMACINMKQIRHMRMVNTPSVGLEHETHETENSRIYKPYLILG